MSVNIPLLSFNVLNTAFWIWCYLDRNTTLDFRDDFAQDFNIWDANKDGRIDILEVGKRKKIGL